MNKQALKLKQKRKALRQQMKQEEMNKIWDEMIECADKMGLPPMKKTKEKILKVYKATKQLDNEVVNKTGVIAVLCSLITLYENFNYDKQKLIRYALKLKKFIISFAATDRPITSLLDEIERDYGVDIIHRSKLFPRMSIEETNKYNKNDKIIKCTVNNIAWFECICAYVFMNDMAYNDEKSWNHDDLELFVTKSYDIYSGILKDTSKLLSYNDYLLNNCELEVDLKTGTLKEII